MNTIDLVVARYKEDVSWISEVPSNFNVIVYNKETVTRNKYTGMIKRTQLIINHPKVRIISLTNVGRESDTYLYHITKNYNKLADITIFSQGDPFVHSPDFLELLQHANLYKSVQPLTDRYMGDTPPPKVLTERRQDHIHNLRVCAYPMCFTNYQTIWFNDPGSFDVVKDFVSFSKVPNGTNIVSYVLEECGFDFKNVPLIGNFCYAAIFAVQRDNIKQHTLESYERLRTMNNNSCKMFPSVLERIWLFLFGYENLVRNENFGL